MYNQWLQVLQAYHLVLALRRALFVHAHVLSNILGLALLEGGLGGVRESRVVTHDGNCGR